MNTISTHYKERIQNIDRPSWTYEEELKHHFGPKYTKLIKKKKGKNPMKKDIENLIKKSSASKRVLSFGGHSSKSFKDYTETELEEAINKSKSK